MSRPIACKVVTPTGIVFEDQVTAVKAPGFHGKFELLGKHAPYLVMLQAGRVTVQGEGGEELYSLEIESGYLTIAGNSCTVLIENIKEETG